MRHFFLTVSFAALACTTALAEDISVTSAADSGPGSLRAALHAAAKSDSPTRIFIGTKDPIALKSGLSYVGTSELLLLGKGATIALDRDETILRVQGATRLEISDIALHGPGGWSIEHKSTAEAPASGIEILALDTKNADVRAMLHGVLVSGVSGYGIYVSDCTSTQNCKGDGDGGSISLMAQRLTIKDTGFGRYNADGLRVEEYGTGDLHFHSYDSRYVNNGADGIELDEHGAGNLSLHMQSDLVEGNGFYCATEILGKALPEIIEAEFEQGTMAQSQLPAPISGSADDACIEYEIDRYVDGSIEAYEFEIDVEDGVDVTEKGEGSVSVIMKDVTVRGNDDEGLDFDEYGDGNINGRFENNVFEKNADDGLKLSERDDGHTIAQIHQGSALANGDRGYLIEEEGNGDLSATISDVTALGNGNAGIEAVQEDAGKGKATIGNATIDNDIEMDGVIATKF